ncbi:MAG: SDR family NAD(P)-dependent oxidoreductase [Bacteroidales bacterium]|jgi:NADP-dependent 3-hydroxy acid dehydrogenase YdfG|nr:SDR family NAD(P)-dependent oxidoreductase [Bacteroidales bacterium]
MNNKLAYITGATSGIGRAIALRLAKNGYNTVITGRRKQLLDSLCEEIKDKYQTDVLVSNYDVRDRKSVEHAIENLPPTWKNPDVLVNNAGLAAGLNSIQEGNPDDWEQMIDTNIKGLLYVSRMIAPRMIQQGYGHIINIGSIAGKEVYPNGNVYCATKHAVDALTKAMRIDMLPYGIKVTQIAPGAAETEFSLVRFKGDKQTADNVYKGFTPLSGEDVADVVEYLLKLPEHVCLNDIVMTCLAQANTTMTHKKLN